jgi:soluble lytic murein transglycosylase-like protein
MTLTKRLARRAALLACAAAVALGGPARAEMPQALSADDARAYAAAFEATDRGDFIDAQMQAAGAGDKSLIGYLSFRQLMHPTAHIAAFDELAGWLGRFRDLPVADRIFALAAKRKTDPAVEAPRPLISLGDGYGGAAMPALSEKALRAREAFFAGDVRRGLKLAQTAGDRWVVGLAAWRLGDAALARTAFADLARDADGEAWTQAAAFVWAARAAQAQGDADGARGFLRAAARNGETFYGMLAARQLKLADQAALAGDQVGQLIMAAYARPAADLARFVAADARAHRAAALAQIGRGAEAVQELRAGLALARTPEERARWRDLMAAMGASLAERGAPLKGYDLDYPTPLLSPKDGFTIDRALVYAIVRQESRFNPQAVSPRGAVGLMQLMPEAAAAAAGDDKLRANRTPLFDPEFNLRVGQDYVTWLFERGVGHDLVKAVAAYNGGPTTIARTLQMLGPEADPLTFIECLPSGETRAYVQRVLAGYWTYRKLWGQASPSLDALAAGGRTIDERLDLADPGGVRPQLASQALHVGMN